MRVGDRSKALVHALEPMDWVAQHCHVERAACEQPRHDGVSERPQGDSGVYSTQKEHRRHLSAWLRRLMRGGWVRT